MSTRTTKRMPIVMIVGKGNVGKTTLAKAIREHTGRFRVVDPADTFAAGSIINTANVDLLLMCHDGNDGYYAATTHPVERLHVNKSADLSISDLVDEILHILYD